MIENFEEYMAQSKEVRQSHINLNEPCLERGGNSTNHRGVLAQFLLTIIPIKRVAILCHACNNSKCSNPKHLYWGTDRENIVEDGKNFGTYKSPWDRMVEKYGLEKAKEMNRKKANQNGKGNKGKPKSEAHKRAISEALKRRARGENGETQRP